MNSAELPAPLHIPAESSAWEDVRRIFRRVCILRATGKPDEARDVEITELAQALATARISFPLDDEAAILAAESERVSNASVLAELLAPMLAERLRSTLAVAPSVMASAPAPIRAAVAPSKPVPRPPAEKVPSITDLIDGMLSQESPPPPAPVRP